MKYRNDLEFILAALDRSITEEEFEELESRLAHEPGLRKLYLKHCQLQHALTEEFEGVHGLPDRFRALDQAPVPRRVVFGTVLAAAAIVMAMGVAAFFITVKGPGPRAAVSFGPLAAGELGQGRVGRTDTEMEIGSQLTLERGTAEITLASGVRTLVEGPAIIKITDRNSVALPSGRAWFDVPRGAEGFICETESLVVKDLGTRFGVSAEEEGHCEVFVEWGRVQAWPLKRPEEAIELRTGDRRTWNGARFIESEEKVEFVSDHPRIDLIFQDLFNESDGTPLHDKLPTVGLGSWQVEKGMPRLVDQLVDTSGGQVEAFASLPGDVLNDRDHILLVSLEVDEPDSRRFHSEGWAGISLFTGTEERIFFGDPFGPGVSWALHPFGSDAVMPSPPLQGKRTVSLRYDYRTGLAELFEGLHCAGQPLASEWIPAGLKFDRLRIGNGEGGDLAVRRLEVRVLTHSPPPEKTQ